MHRGDKPLLGCGRGECSSGHSWVRAGLCWVRGQPTRGPTPSEPSPETAQWLSHTAWVPAGSLLVRPPPRRSRDREHPAPPPPSVQRGCPRVRDGTAFPAPAPTSNLQPLTPALRALLLSPPDEPSVNRCAVMFLGGCDITSRDRDGWWGRSRADPEHMSPATSFSDSHTSQYSLALSPRSQHGTPEPTSIIPTIRF